MYAVLILPLALPELYHYRLPEPTLLGEAVVRPGMRVVAPLGPKRFFTGIVLRLESELPESVAPSRVKPIESVLDAEPIVDEATLALWTWMADYYQCSLGHVMRTALPGGLMPESQTLVMLDEGYVASGGHSPVELEVLDALAAVKGARLSMGQLRQRIGRGCPAALSRLISLGAIYTEERLSERYQPRRAAYISIADEFASEAGLMRAEQLLRRAPKQQALLYELIELLSSCKEGLGGAIRRSLLTRREAGRLTLLRALTSRGILRLEEREEGRLDEGCEPRATLDIPPQAPFTKPVGLLYTRRSESREAYILGQIRRVLSEGRQVLLLTPSPMVGAHTSAFLQQAREVAGGRLWAYHRMMSEHLRSELYLRLASDASPCLVVGTRSAVFLPLRSLGLIIVDEEQEYLYKEQYTPPLYHARDVALWLGHRRGVPILLATETPSAEALFNMLRGKYELVTTDEDTDEVPALPLDIIDLEAEQRAGRLPYGTTISWTLREQMERTLARGERVLLLHNRRGYAPYALCSGCSGRITCPSCSVSLVYHSDRRSMLCHYCNYEQMLPTVCPSCGAREVEKPWGNIPALTLVGYGLERVEEEIEGFLPEARVLRIDSDSLQSRRQLLEVEARLLSEDVDVLIGTQLIKGRPLSERIGLVAVVNLDTMIGFSDFRAQERVYQLLRQLTLRLSGRAGVRMVIQTRHNAAHPFLAGLAAGDYRGFIKGELLEREATRFPPFVRLTYIRLRGFDEPLVERTAHHLADILQTLRPAGSVLPPHSPSVARIDGQYLRHIACRRPYSEGYEAERRAFTLALEMLRTSLPESSRVRILFDIDPL